MRLRAEEDEFDDDDLDEDADELDDVVDKDADAPNDFENDDEDSGDDEKGMGGGRRVDHLAERKNDQDYEPDEDDRDASCYEDMFDGPSDDEIEDAVVASQTWWRGHD